MRLIAVAAILLTSCLAVTGVGTTCSKETASFAVLMDIAPEQTGHFIYWAVADLNADEDLWPIYDRFKGSSDAEQLRQLVEVLATVKDSARILGADNATVQEDAVTVLRANFDSGYVQDKLQTLGYSRSVHRDVGIWIPGDVQPYRPVALLSGKMLIGSASELKACIDTAKHKADSFYDYPHIQVLAKKLPKGIIVEAHRTTASPTESYAHLVAYGKSYSKVRRDLLKMTAVYVFDDGPAAGTAVQSIRDDLSAGFQDVKVNRDDNLVVAGGRISVSDFLQTLVY